MLKLTLSVTLYCAANFDNFVNMLSDLYYPFSLIGLTETKIKFGQDPITNCELPGYRFVSQPSYLNVGGVGFFIKNEIKFTQRTDLTSSKNELEALWIEVQNEDQCNMVCGIIYRHPSGNVGIFQEYIDIIIDKIQRENKYCIMLGDFNLDLLKFAQMIYDQPRDILFSPIYTSTNSNY